MHTTQEDTLRNIPKSQLVQYILSPVKQVKQVAAQGTHVPNERVYPGIHSTQVVTLNEQFKQNETEQFEQ